MKRFLIVMAAAMFLFLSACSGQKAKETFETAKLEELQRNFSHARQLYREIIEKYPKSEYAEKAAERLKELETK
jgi:TolA-binding protein